MLALVDELELELLAVEELFAELEEPALEPEVIAELELIAPEEPALVAEEPALVAAPEEPEEELVAPPELLALPLSSSEDALTPPEEDAITPPEEDALTPPEEDALTPPEEDALVPPSAPLSSPVSPEEKDPHPPPTAPSSTTQGTSTRERVFIIATSPGLTPRGGPECLRGEITGTAMGSDGPGPDRLRFLLLGSTWGGASLRSRLLPVSCSLYVLQDKSVGRIRRQAGRNGAFKVGSKRRVAVVAADAQDDGARRCPRGRSLSVVGNGQGARLRVTGADFVFRRTTRRARLERAEGIRHVRGR
jgi:hypothetical protein